LTAYATLEKKFLRDETQTMRVIGKSDVYKLISLFFRKKKRKQVSYLWMETIQKEGNPNDYAYLDSQTSSQDLQICHH